jgi:hypothetical protein
VYGEEQRKETAYWGVEVGCEKFHKVGEKKRNPAPMRCRVDF